MRIALLEDDPFQSEVVARVISQAGHNIVSFTDGAAMLRVLGRSSFDMLILDWRMPGLQGIEVLRAVRSRHKDYLPILFITAQEGEENLVRALDQGADDYITKPFRVAELRARVAALLRRAYPIPHNGLPFDVGPYHFDLPYHQVTLRGRLITLTGIEFQLTLLLFSNPGRILSRDYIFGRVWARDTSTYTRTIDSHISRIRMKLQIEPRNQVQLVAVYKQGYRLDYLACRQPAAERASPDIKAAACG